MCLNLYFVGQVKILSLQEKQYFKKVDLQYYYQVVYQQFNFAKKNPMSINVHWIFINILFIYIILQFREVQLQR